MMVLMTIGAIAGVIILYLLVSWINRYSYSKYRYEFFSFSNYVVTGVGYFLIYFGQDWHAEALVNSGDVLNGQLLMGIGAVLILAVFVNHVRNTNFLFAVVVGAFQIVLYIPLAYLGAFALVAMVAALFDTKPVYRIN